MRKKAIAGTLITLFILLTGIYLFIPSEIKISHIQNVAVPAKAVMRCFNDPPKMEKWWPGKIINAKEAVYNGYHFTFSNFNIVGILKAAIYTGSMGDSSTSSISSNVLGTDSSFLYWTCELKTSLSPVKRVRQYLKALKIKKAMTGILNSFSGYSSSTKNVYGFSIAKGKVTDTVYISEKKELSRYPGTTEIYASINSLRRYMDVQNISPVNYPICNITPKNGGGFGLIVAIPINKHIKESEIQRIKTMLYNGNLLITEVRGGDYTINKVLEAHTNFIDDYHLTPAVLPYQSLITDREKITDSTKWVTKICSPIY